MDLTDTLGDDDFQPPRSQNKLDRIWEVNCRMMERVGKKTLLPRNSQLARVASQLCSSVCESAARRDEQSLTGGPAEEFVKEQSERICDILSATPPAFHHCAIRTADGRESNLFELKMPDMVEHAKDVPDIKPEDLIRAYGMVWAHGGALDAIRQNGESQSRRAMFLRVDRNGVEYIANLYLESEDLISPLLEWAIVDALVFERISEFASGYAFSRNLPDVSSEQRIDGPLLPEPDRVLMGTKRHGFHSFAKPAVRLIFELLALGITSWLCELLTDSESLAKWILFSGITAGRWVSAAVRENGEEARRKAAAGETILQMVWDMGVAHERVCTMHVDLLRHLFYRLEERGAAFSSTIYAILDKRSNREPARSSL